MFFSVAPPNTAQWPIFMTACCYSLGTTNCVCSSQRSEITFLYKCILPLLPQKRVVPHLSVLDIPSAKCLRIFESAGVWILCCSNSSNEVTLRWICEKISRVCAPETAVQICCSVCHIVSPHESLTPFLLPVMRSNSGSFIAAAWTRPEKNGDSTITIGQLGKSRLSHRSSSHLQSLWWTGRDKLGFRALHKQLICLQQSPFVLISSNLYQLMSKINCFREINVSWLVSSKVLEVSKMKAWTDESFEELYVWFVLTMLMPHVKKQVLQDYWIVDDLISTPSFRN